MRPIFKKIKNIYEFYIRIFLDSLVLFPFIFLSISFVKLIRLSLVTFVFLQIFYFYNKFIILEKYTLNYEDYLYVLFILFIFPIFFIYEKFYTGNFFAFLYDKKINNLFHVKAVERMYFFKNIFKLWLVFLLSQTRLLIDIIIAFILFLLYIFAFHFEAIFSLPILYIYTFFTLIVFSPLFIITSLYIFRIFSFIFIFWQNDDRLSLIDSIKENNNKTKDKKFLFWGLYIGFRILEILLLLSLIYILYFYLLNIVSFLNFNLSLFLIIIYALSTFIFIISLDSTFWIRIYNLIENKKITKNLNINKVIFLKLRKTIFINLILLTSFLSFIYVNTIFYKNMLENKKIEEIIKYPLIIKMYNQENFSINKYYSALYANGIAVNIYNKNRELLVKPLSSETNNRFIPSSVNLFQTSFFNLNQLTVPDDTVLKFSEIINLSVRNKITMFSYVQDIGTAELLAKNIKLGDSYYLILFTDNNEVYKYVKENIKGIRVSLLLEDVDLNNYQDKILFTFWSDLSKLNKDEIESKNIKVYAILKKGEEALNVESLSKIRGVMTDLPELNFKQTKNISSRDLYDSVIKSPLKFFGF